MTFFLSCDIGAKMCNFFKLAKDFPHLTITINGGFNTTQQIKEQLELVDGIMIGREVMDRPMFLAKVDAGKENNTQKVSLFFYFRPEPAPHHHHHLPFHKKKRS